MLSMKNKLIANCYIGFSAVYLLIILFGHTAIAWYLKPFLLPFLLYWVYTFEDFPTKKILLTALSFSWIGDIILMFTDKGELYFIFGLVAFLLSHIVYIALFSKQLKTENNKNNWLFAFGIGVIIVYLLLMLSLLLPNLGDLKIPVTVYAMVISTMLLFALKGSFNWSKPGNFYILLGAIIFVSSDSILAFNKFYKPIFMDSFLIMATYIVAQYLIVKGILELNKRTADTN
jgi:uncharacterized membrane protein YhhN